VRLLGSPIDLWRSHNSTFLRGWVSSPTSNSQPGGPGTTFSLAPTLDLSCMGGPTRSLRSRQHSSPGHLDAQTSSQRYGCSSQGLKHKLQIKYSCMSNNKKFFPRSLALFLEWNFEILWIFNSTKCGSWATLVSRL
jgi:hypothetical protein